MTRNCYNVMRKLASMYKEATDYATQWGSRYRYTDAELAPYRHLVTPSANQRTLSLVHERIHAARAEAKAARAKSMVNASLPQRQAPSAVRTQAIQPTQQYTPLRPDLPPPQPDPTQAGPQSPMQAQEQTGLEFGSLGS